MKIVELRAENVKKLTAVVIRPNGNLVQVTGPNGSGKTSVLDSIMWALGGTKGIQSQPIRRGAKTAGIRLDLGELIVTRRFNESGSTVHVESADGARFPSPQAMLDKLLGEIAFDPLAFARMKPREQFDTLRGLVKVDIDFEKLERQQRGDFERRTDLNRDAKAKRAQLAAYAPFAPDLPAEKIDTRALADAIADAGKHNENIERRKDQRERAAKDADALEEKAREERARAEKLRREAEAWDKQAADREQRAAELRQKLAEAPPLPEPVDVAQVKAKLADAETVNAELDRKARRDELDKQAATIDAQVQELTERMQAREKAKQEAIAAAEMPVEGLGFGNGEVLFNGVPFEQASDAEQLRVSTAIAMACNPKLRVIRIRDGSLLDEKGLTLLAEMADEKGFQVWIERVDSSGKVGVVMEDGHVVCQHTETEEPAHATA